MSHAESTIRRVSKEHVILLHLTCHACALLPCSVMDELTTHVLDTARGRPAEGVCVTLSSMAANKSWTVLGSGVTDKDGRCPNLLPGAQLQSSQIYKLHFDTASYFTAEGTEAFFPFVEVVFKPTSPSRRYHVPLLLSPFGYTTYRGS